ncbi:MAG: twin-arginine translocase TatA/TatE family subunit [Methylococcaceae bacterium]|nr:twin-arginine translocase TatA/TatE family subunit [Methylococcaceae bacterium]
MGFGGISPMSLIIILVIVILLFGTKKLRSMGGDLGSAIKNFKKSVHEGEDTVNNNNDASISHSDDNVKNKTSEKDTHSS